ncbi:MAG: C2H2-type zinc finger protein [Planctomycetota bacterium]
MLPFIPAPHGTYAVNTQRLIAMAFLTSNGLDPQTSQELMLGSTSTAKAFQRYAQAVLLQSMQHKQSTARITSPSAFLPSPPPPLHSRPLSSSSSSVASSSAAAPPRGDAAAPGASGKVTKAPHYPPPPPQSLQVAAYNSSNHSQDALHKSVLNLSLNSASSSSSSSSSSGNNNAQQVTPPPPPPPAPTGNGRKPARGGAPQRISSSMGASIVNNVKERMRGRDPENMYIQCQICGKRIKRLYHFHRHMRIHTGDKTHQCPYCNYKSVRKDNLKSHMKTHEKHMNNAAATTPTAAKQKANGSQRSKHKSPAANSFGTAAAAAAPSAAPINGQSRYGFYYPHHQFYPQLAWRGDAVLYPPPAATAAPWHQQQRFAPVPQPPPPNPLHHHYQYARFDKKRPYPLPPSPRHRDVFVASSPPKQARLHAAASSLTSLIAGAAAAPSSSGAVHDHPRIREIPDAPAPPRRGGGSNGVVVKNGTAAGTAGDAATAKRNGVASATSPHPPAPIFRPYSMET